MFDNRFQS